MKYVILGLSIIALAGIILVPTQSFKTRTAAESKGEHLKETLFLEPKGWSVRSVELGPTEAVAEQVSKILNYDDNFYYQYEKGDTVFSLYVSYWGAGKMPAQLVASHTPDRCWTENGMTCTDMDFNVVAKVGDKQLLPAQSRVYTSPGQAGEQFVYYWHLIDDELYDYGTRFNAVPHPLKWVRDAVGDALLGTREQYFIRINANKPIEQIWNMEGVQEVAAQLKKIGL